MRLLLAGASGLLGTALTETSRASGDEVRCLVRRPARSADEISWQPETGELDPTALDGIDAVVCLSGVGVGERRWTDSFRRRILTSRTETVGTLARAIAASDSRPAVFVSASAVGYYGDTGTDPVDESSPAGEGFFPDVCVAWEQAAEPAASAGVRTAQIRTGIVLARHGPVLARMLPLFRLGVGGPLGRGRQYWSWITLADEIAAIRFVLATEGLSGPVNLCAPEPVTNAVFARTLARVVHRPALFPAPEFALRVVLGDFAGEILASQRVLPTALLGAGFRFSHPELEAGLRAELGR
jgi:uncharacterized protein (TIGR01777 family)